MTVSPDLGRLTDVRRQVRLVVAAEGLPAARLFDMEVAVSEACANAIEHGCAGQDVVLTVERGEDRIVIRVHSPAAFRVRSWDGGAGRQHRGLGLPLMVALADRLSVSQTGEGGTVVELTFLLPQNGRCLEAGSCAGAG